jgi:hypothetical protein
VTLVFFAIAFIPGPPGQSAVFGKLELHKAHPPNPADLVSIAAVCSRTPMISWAVDVGPKEKCPPQGECRPQPLLSLAILDAMSSRPSSSLARAKMVVKAGIEGLNGAFGAANG